MRIASSAAKPIACTLSMTCAPLTSMGSPPAVRLMVGEPVFANSMVSPDSSSSSAIYVSLPPPHGFPARHAAEHFPHGGGDAGVHRSPGYVVNPAVLAAVLAHPVFVALVHLHFEVVSYEKPAWLQERACDAQVLQHVLVVVAPVDEHDVELSELV